MGVVLFEPGNRAFIEFTSPAGTDCRGDAPGNREHVMLSPTGVVDPLHIPGVLGEGTGNLESMEGVVGPPEELKLQLALAVLLVLLLLLLLLLTDPGFGAVLEEGMELLTAQLD